MKPEALSTRAAKLEGKRAFSDLLDAVEGLPRHQKSAFMARIMKKVVRVQSRRPRQAK